MHASGRVRAEAFLVLVIMTAGGFAATSHSSAEEPALELVPEPFLRESHDFGFWGDDENTDDCYFNERWNLEILHGDVMTLISARNMTQGDETSVDYQFNVHYTVGGHLYVGGLTINRMALIVGNETILTPLGTCEGFELEASPVIYDSAVPTVDCSVTFEGIRVYEDGPVASTFDLTLFHHFVCDWNDTDVKVDAHFDFSDTRLCRTDGTEFGAGEPFAAEIRYTMELGDDTYATEGPITPSGHTNTTLEYNITMDNGLPLTVSELRLNDTFSIVNSSGSTDSVGYTGMELFGGRAEVTHGFPGLAYGDTISVRSDPEIIVYHDRVTADDSLVGELLWVLVPAVAAVAVLAAIMVLRKRRAGRPR